MRSIAEMERTAKRLFAYWPGFLDTHRIQLHQIASDKVWIGYRTREGNMHAESTHVEINVIDDVLYILHIEIDRGLRGMGLGSLLYTICEQLARSLGCRQIRQTPSGVTPTGEYRRDYLLRRQWSIDGNEVYKNLTDSGDKA